MKITFKSEDPRSMDAFIGEVIAAVKSAGGTVFGPVPLPTRSERASPKSNTYLGALVKKSAFVERFHLRALRVDGMSAKVREALMAMKAPGVVKIEIADD